LTGQTSPATPTNFQLNAAWVETSILASESQAFKDLLISFLTIRNYRDLLFEPETDLRNDLTDEFINKFMRVDFSRIILGLRDYTGDDRRGIQEAYKFMEAALRELYKMGDANKDWVDATLDCRNKLHAAFQQLEHLSTYLP
jgi:hypothetical protein